MKVFLGALFFSTIVLGPLLYAVPKKKHNIFYSYVDTQFTKKATGDYKAHLRLINDKVFFKSLASKERFVKKEDGYELNLQVAKPSLINLDPKNYKQLGLKSTFEVAWQHKDFKPYFAKIKKEFGQRPTVDQLVKFVSQYIIHKDYTQADGSALEVLRSKRGDCTEHSVLLLATLRGFGYSAMSVNGIAVVKFVDSDKHTSVGHEWVEVYDQGKWRVVDAAIDTVLFYIPLAVQRYEGIDAIDSIKSMVSILEVDSVKIK